MAHESAIPTGQSSVKDVIENSFIRQTRDSLEAARVFILKGVSGSPKDLLLKGLKGVNIPRIGDAHPSTIVAELFGTQVFLDEIRVEPLSSSHDGDYRLILLYRPNIEEDAQVEREIVTTIVPARTNLEIGPQGQLQQIILKHTFLDTDDQGNTIERPEEQSQILDIQIPQTIRRFKRIEDQEPVQATLDFTGKLNSVQFLSQPARHWLCKAITSRPRTDGRFNVNYEFQFNSRSWDETIQFIGDDGLPPPNLVPGEGIRQIKVLEGADFNKLKLLV